MAVFTTDQSRQYYVVKSVVDELTKDSPAGTLAVMESNEDIWFEYVSPNANMKTIGDGITRSPLINKKCIESITKATGRGRVLKVVEVGLNPDINGGQPVAGQEYILKMRFIGLTIGGNENQYYKSAGVYRAKSGDTPTKVMEALKKSFDLNFSREPVEYVTAEVAGDKLVITEVLQPWVLGRKQGHQVDFQINTSEVIFEGGFYPWGVTEVKKGAALPNGPVVADMEWFYFGERADVARNFVYPMNFDYKFLTDPTKNYDSIDIHHFYEGDTEDVQKSKGYVTLVGETSVIDSIFDKLPQ